jgi:hypothetical protein
MSVEPVGSAVRAGQQDPLALPPRRPPRSNAEAQGGTLSWPVLLGALEERTRRLASVIESGEDVELPDVPLRADGPLPPDLEFRARTLLAETERLARRAEQRKAATERELRYRQG